MYQIERDVTFLPLGGDREFESAFTYALNYCRVLLGSDLKFGWSDHRHASSALVLASSFAPLLSRLSP